MKNFPIVLALVGALVAAPAAAQSVDPQHFKPTPDAAALFTVDTADIRPDQAVDVGVVFNYGRNLLVLRDLGSGERVGAFLSDRLNANLLASIGLWNLFEVGVDVPIIGFQAGATGLGMLPPQPTQQLSPVGIGDIRLLVKAQLMREETHGVSVAFLPVLTLPTGGALGGLGGVSVMPELVLSRHLGAVRLASNLGIRLQPRESINALSLGHALTWRLGGGLDLEALGAELPMEVIAEVYGQANLDASFRHAPQTPVEGLVGMRYALPQGLAVEAGAGRGLTLGYGAPEWRAFAGLRYAAPRDASTKAPSDRDGDGVPDRRDACPDTSGVAERDGCPIPDRDGDDVEDGRDACPDEPGIAERDGCPIRDRDGDGVEDGRDACPDEPGLAERDGCPIRDRDGDGVEDGKDACPDQPGPAERSGCPIPDTDADGVPDHLDNCPKVAGPASNQGCPESRKQLVVITESQLEIKEKVFFATGRSTVLPRSFELLNQVAEVIRAHPDKCPVLVEGHTDSSGGAELNRRLSLARAQAVRTYLIKQTVDPGCLEARGFGPDRPISGNETAEGREANRRVEFRIQPKVQP